MRHKEGRSTRLIAFRTRPLILELEVREVLMPQDRLDDGQQFRKARTFGMADIRAFAQVSHDAGVHHVEPDASGRLMVHGLLTATIATELGGELDYIARSMEFEFLRPVWTGDTIECLATVLSVDERPARWRYEFSFEFSNQDGDLVAKGGSRGVVLREVVE